MKCFYHQEQDAVGICKSCNKGLCPECAVDLSKGLACKDRCEEEVQKVNALIDQNMQVSPTSVSIVKNMRKNSLTLGIIFIFLGILFLIHLIAFDAPPELNGPMATFSLLFGGFMIWRGTTLPK